MSLDNHQLAKAVLEMLGGASNIEAYTHCMTRLRVTVKDDSIVKKTDIRKLEGVLGLVEEETLQIIIGPGKVNKVTEEFGKLIDESGGINLENRAAQRKSELKEKMQLRLSFCFAELQVFLFR